MRTTIKIDDELLAEAKLRAAQTGRTLNDVVADALRESFARRERHDTERPKLPVFQGSRLMPGVDLDDSAALLELMESEQR